MIILASLTIPEKRKEGFFLVWNRVGISNKHSICLVDWHRSVHPERKQMSGLCLIFDLIFNSKTHRKPKELQS